MDAAMVAGCWIGEPIGAFILLGMVWLLADMRIVGMGSRSGGGFALEGFEGVFCVWSAKISPEVGYKWSPSPLSCVVVFNRVVCYSAETSGPIFFVLSSQQRQRYEPRESGATGKKGEVRK